MDDMSWQYIAGYIDGEGSLLLGIAHDKRVLIRPFGETDGYYLTPALCIQSYDEDVLKRIRDFTHQNGIAYCYEDIKAARKYQLRNTNRLQIGGYRNLRNFIQKIYPYSIAKRPQYDLFFKILDIVDSRKVIEAIKGGHRRWKRIEWLAVAKLIDEINAMKKGKRGREWYPFFCSKWEMKI